MDKNRITGIALAFLNFILLLFCFVRYVQSDRVPPRFLLEAADIIYVPDMDSTELVQGITANDNVDGDVTDRIVIEKITEKQREHTAIVYYAVCDRSGNVAKISKLFHAEYPKPGNGNTQGVNGMPGGEPGQVQGGSGRGSGEQTEPRETDTAGSDSNGAGEPDASMQNQTEEDGKETEVIGQEEGGRPNAPEEEGTQPDVLQEEGTQPDVPEEEGTQPDVPEGESTQPDVSEEEGTQPDVPEDESTQPAGLEDGVQAEPESAEGATSGAPELVLGRSGITIDAGTNPPWTEIITTMRDDKDNYETLYYNLHVSQFNRSRPGTYPVTVYVEDSDGNRSQEVPFTIIVR